MISSLIHLAKFVKKARHGSGIWLHTLESDAIHHSFIYVP